MLSSLHKSVKLLDIHDRIEGVRELIEELYEKEIWNVVEARRRQKVLDSILDAQLEMLDKQ